MGLRYTLVFLLLAAAQLLYGTHNRAGEITYRQIGPLEIEMTIVTYTRTSSEQADRDTLIVLWGDGSSEERVGRISEEFFPNDTKKNIYTARHKYGATGHYVISMTDPNRNADIVNIENSVNVPFHIETTVTLFPTLFEGFNNSPVLELPPIDIACVGERFIHNPGAYDPDGDSLAYRLIVPYSSLGVNVPNYVFPDQIVPTNNMISLDPRTGDFVWESPQRKGEYNIAIQIISYRNGIARDSLIRDMQILVEDCTNEAPVIETEEEICVIAGELIDIPVRATAPISEADQQVALTAVGGPLILDRSPATFTVNPGYQPQPLIGQFTWQTTCDHIADQFYTVIFRAIDDKEIQPSTPGDDPLFLSTIHVLRIKIVAPPPEDVQLLPGSGQIEVTWESPYKCEDASDNYFQGFSVWRRETSNQFTIDTCNPGLEGQGYQRLNISLSRTLQAGRYYYLDNTVERGRTYCYRVLGEFARTSDGGIPYNIVESLPSNEACVQLSQDVPLITNVDVLETDQNTGRIVVKWIKPNPADLDTIENPGPYRYQLLRSPGINTNNFTPIPGADFTTANFSDPVATVFEDGVDTETLGYTYQLAFYTEGLSEPLGTSPPASSIFLSIVPADERNNLSWTEVVPWDNYEYTVFRRNAVTGFWEEIGTTTEPMYEDSGLKNGTEYCYYIMSTGSYGIDSLPDPLLNNSQEVCARPMDNQLPCPPVLEPVINDCDSESFTCLDNRDYVNSLEWSNPNIDCEDTDDVIAYLVLYAEVEGVDFDTIERIDDPFETSYDHFLSDRLAGCYAVVAIDSFENRSVLSNIECVDNCPSYVLPNTFTPNGDGQNELFVPIRRCFIDRVEFQVFNRWGNLIFETTDPALNWDGRNMDGTEVSEGVYFYACKYFETRVSGIEAGQELLKGYIEVIR